MATQLSMLGEAYALPQEWTSAVVAGKIAVTREVKAALGADCAVAIGVSGGKDSDAAAFATVEFLDVLGHKGPRVLIHADLGRVEWKESLPQCERLAAALGLELMVVRREAGDMMDRWLTRWDRNRARYENLECVKLILPWSTPSMRFCTSELKTAVICRALCARFPGQTVLNVVGIRRQESAGRAKMPVSQPQAKLTSQTYQVTGMNWHSIIDWTLEEVLAYTASKGFPRHEAYTRYGASRVSCVNCIMSTEEDERAAGECPDNHDIYREMVDLEVSSTFSFHGDRWLADVNPHLLSVGTLEMVLRAKQKARLREEAETRIPAHLLFEKGWPNCVPTQAEAKLLCEVRATVAGLLKLRIRYAQPKELIARYTELMAEKNARATANN